MRGLTALAATAALLAACDREETLAPEAAPATSAEAATGVILSARPEQRRFRDWRAACDNGAACFAFARSSEPDAGWLRLSVAAEADATPDVVIGLSPGADGLSSTTPLVLTIDGERFTTRRIDAEAPMGRLAAADAMTVVRAAAAGTSAAISAGGQSARLSLAGASAAMLWIDERQGRLETAGALVRVGDRPASARAPALPRVAAAPAVDQAGFGGEDQALPAAIEALPAVKTCRQETAWNDHVQRAVLSARLGPDRELWAVPCFAGAYNLGLAVYVTGPGGRDPVAAALPTAEGRTKNTVVNADYDPETRSLSAFDKGRGLGDCGVVRRWVWNGRGFALAEETEMRECAGVPRDLWPTLWRSL